MCKTIWKNQVIRPETPSYRYITVQLISMIYVYFERQGWNGKLIWMLLYLFSVVPFLLWNFFHCIWKITTSLTIKKSDKYYPAVTYQYIGLEYPYLRNWLAKLYFCLVKLKTWKPRGRNWRGKPNKLQLK